MARSHSCSAACTDGWGSTRKCHCSNCGENFSTPRNFDKHQQAGTDLTCLPPAKAGLAQNARGVWIQPGEVDISERFGR